MANIGRMIIPAVAGGMLITIFSLALSVIPFATYVCCFAYIPFGGFISAALTKLMNGGEKLESRDGIVAGALAGFVAALLSAVVMLLLIFVFGGLQFGVGALGSLAANDLAPLLAFGGTGLIAAVVMLAVTIAITAFYFIVDGVLGAIGGAICAALLYRKS